MARDVIGSSIARTVCTGSCRHRFHLFYGPLVPVILSGIGAGLKGGVISASTQWSSPRSYAGRGRDLEPPPDTAGRRACLYILWLLIVVPLGEGPHSPKLLGTYYNSMAGWCSSRCWVLCRAGQQTSVRVWIDAVAVAVLVMFNLHQDQLRHDVV
jgi:hypothetical protein